ncbi:MAG: DUF2279 domain-containing protein [Bacteroidota bacterium]|nr:DUF2279 domain-containing protein [Bacteroidota bacterium]
MTRVLFLIAISLILNKNLLYATSQTDSSKTIIKIINIGVPSAAVISLVGINEVWYKNYARSDFHFFDDLKEWNGMDKIGHACTSYQLNKISHSLFEKNNIKKPLLKSSVYTFGYMLGVELLDGYSTEWGFSIYDVIGNGLGTILYTFQERKFKNQPFKIKFSSHKSTYASCRPSLLGENRLQQILKDYNGQTYWLTFNYNELWNKRIKLFDYIDFAFGYSIDGFTGGHNNPEISSCNCLISNCNNLKRTSQFIFSVDLNTSKIKNKHPILGKFLLPFDIVKIPFPAFILNNSKNFKLIYF